MKVLVIGGTRGFGASVTRELWLAGNDVVTVGRSDGDFICDVSDVAAWSSTVEHIVREHGAFDLIVCVVGYARAKPSAMLTTADWISHASANIWYVETALTRIPHRRFVTTGSQWSHRIGNDELIPYIQSKHALRELTRDKGGVHYCVPTMDTPQLWQVWSGTHSAAQLADTAVVAHAMVNHLVAHTLPANYNINNKGAVLPLPS